ncbi:MAG: hypothetical protein WA827_21110 [Candidatus Binatus sp.]|jgi:hypothetical protein
MLNRATKGSDFQLERGNFALRLAPHRVQNAERELRLAEPQRVQKLTRFPRD